MNARFHYEREARLADGALNPMRGLVNAIGFSTLIWALIFFGVTA